MTIKERLAQGQEVRVFMLGPLASPKYVEVAAVTKSFHGLWIDQEHSAIPHREVELIMMACRSSQLDGFVRVPPTDYGTIMRPMEAGATGIMVAQIRQIEQVKQVLAWAKYPPQGIRGLFMNNFEARYATTPVVDHLEESNRKRWMCIQIETPESVGCAYEIAALDGVDTLFVGAGDLACTLGVPGQPMHPKCIEALEIVSGAVREAGKSWGILARTADHAKHCRELGCQLFSLAGDVDMIHRGIAAIKSHYSEFFDPC